MTGTDALLADHGPEVRAIFGALTALVREAMPDANEQLDLPDHLLAFGFGPPGGTRLRDFAVALIPHRAHVNVQLADGALLDDPTGIIEGTGKRIRHGKCGSVDDVNLPALRAILVQQAAQRRA
jgi:hypothetical protein